MSLLRTVDLPLVNVESVVVTPDPRDRRVALTDTSEIVL